MKKISIALASMLMAGHAAAADMALTAANTKVPVTASSASQVVSVTTGTALFIVNPFNFTVSAGVAMSAVQDAGNMAVSSGATKGRNVFTGHSNGGSVSQCDAPTVAGSTTTPATIVATGTRMVLANIDGCSIKGAIVAAPAPAPTPTP